MTPRAVATGVVGLVAVAPLALEPLARALGMHAQSALAALPWIAWSALPRGDRERGSLARAALLVALAASAIGLGLGLDLARSIEPSREIARAAVCVALVATSAFAAELCAGTRWFVAHALVALVLLVAPIAVLVLESAGAPLYGTAHAALGFVARASPLGVGFDALANDRLPAPWFALALSVGGVALGVHAQRARAGEERE